MGLQQVLHQLESKYWAEHQPIWLPLLDLLPVLRPNELWAPFSSGYLQIEKAQIQRWSSLLKRKPGRRLIALHWQGNSSHEHSLYSRGRSLPSNNTWRLANSTMWSSSPFRKGKATNSCKAKMTEIRFWTGGRKPVHGLQGHSRRARQLRSF